MPLLLVLILVLIAFGLLLIGYLTSSILWAWVSVLVSAVAAVVLLSDALQRRSAVRAGDDAPEPASRAAARGVPAEAPAAAAVRPGATVDGATTVVQAQGRPVAPRRSGPVDPVTEVIPAVRSGGWRPDADAERTVVMPVVRPSGSPGAPPGAPAPVPPSGEFLSRNVTMDGGGTPDARAVPTGASTSAGDATMVVPAAALGRRPAGDGPAQVVGPAEEPHASPVDADPDPDGAPSREADTAAPPVARGSSAGPPGGPVGESADRGSDDRSAAQPPGDVPVPSGSGAGSGVEPDTGSGTTGGSDGPAVRSSVGDSPVGASPVDAPPADGPVADAPPADGPVADGPVADGPVADGPVADGPVADAPPADAPVADGPVADGPVADVPPADVPPADVPPADGPAADAPPDRAPSVEVPSLDPPPPGAPPVQVPAAQAPVAPAEPPVEESEAETAALVARLDDEVLVVDEHPRYHVPGCRTLLAAPVIPLPAREAVELGFSPCGWCTPDRTLTARHAPARS